MSIDPRQLAWKGASNCIHYGGAEVEETHCDCGKLIVSVKVKCERDGRVLKARRCLFTCPNYEKEATAWRSESHQQ